MSFVLHRDHNKGPLNKGPLFSKHTLRSIQNLHKLFAQNIRSDSQIGLLAFTNKNYYFHTKVLK